MTHPQLPLSDIRLARPKDLDELLLLEAIFPLTDRVTRRNLSRQLKSPSVACLTFDQGGIQGAAVLLFRKTSQVARLYSLSVAENASGKGVGGTLIEACKQEALARHCNRIRLEVRASNSRAISLYKRADFHVIGRLVAYYGDGEDALRMEVSLTDGNDTSHD